MVFSFRQSMSWLHTWLGLVMGYILIVVFFFGTLAVFDLEIDTWAIPQSRFEIQPMPSFERVLLPAMRQLEPELEDGQTVVPRLGYSALFNARNPMVKIFADFQAPLTDEQTSFTMSFNSAFLDPRNGTVYPDDQLRIGSEWFYPMHYYLNLPSRIIGIYIVALASLVMLIALVSGVVIHRKIFREFFTFRPKKQSLRSTLDLHNMTGVVALPFHFFFVLSGLLVFASFNYFPVSQYPLKGLSEHSEQSDNAINIPENPAGVAAPVGSIDAMLLEAQRLWIARGLKPDVNYLEVHFWGDANSYLEVRRASTDRAGISGESIYFNAVTGELLYEEPPASVVSAIEGFLIGLHLIRFKHAFLSWLYVFGGLLGCLCLATGFIFFVEKRKRQHSKTGGQGSRIVDALAVTTITGMLIATFGMLAANRLLPADLLNKGEWEITAFWSLWALAMLHALIRSAPVAQARLNPAWREQCWVVAVLAVAAVLLNAITTGDHLVQTMFLQPYWPVAGVDLSLLVSAAVAVWAAGKLKRREQSQVVGKTVRDHKEKATAVS